MKKFVLSFFTLLLLGSMSSQLIAQSADLTQRCGGKKTFTRKFSSVQCYPKKDYPTKEDAKKQLFEDLDGDADFTCLADSCLNPTDFTCEVDNINLDKGNFADKGDEWCTAKPRIVITWSCTNCTRKPKDTEEKPRDEVPPTEGEGSDREDSESGALDTNFSAASVQQSSNNFGRIERISPNPSSGLFQVNVLNEYEDGQLDLVATDLMGKVLRQKRYTNISASNFHSQIDLSDFQAGIYLLSVRINGQLVGTSKVIVQD